MTRLEDPFWDQNGAREDSLVPGPGSSSSSRPVIDGQRIASPQQHWPTQSVRESVPAGYLHGSANTLRDDFRGYEEGYIGDVYMEQSSTEPFHLYEMAALPADEASIVTDGQSNGKSGITETRRAVNDRPREPSASKQARLRAKRRKKFMKMPWFTWFVSCVQISVFLAELIKMGILTGNPFQTKPSFNPMLGPSTFLLINMGARFTPCMRTIDGVTRNDTLMFPCPNSTSVDTDVCSLQELCGFSLDAQSPNQWWRFVTAIFLHSGFIHIIFNLLLQIKLGGELEQELGHVRYFLVYWISGIGGFLMSGNFAGSGVASVGASGALFGIIAIDLLDLLYNWQLYKRPKMNLMIHVVEIIISFVLGLLPGLDNFAHIGGFATGILTGCALLRSPLKLRLKHPDERRQNKRFDVVKLDYKHIGRHFRNRSSAWWAWWLVRVAALALLIVYFALLGRNFANGGGHCSWCKYLSCLPVHNWCDQGSLFGE